MVNFYLDTRSGLNWSGWFLSFKYMCLVNIYMITTTKKTFEFCTSSIPLVMKSYLTTKPRNNNDF